MIAVMILMGCSRWPDNPDASIAVGVNYACAGSPSQALRCWGGQARLDGQASDTLPADFLTGLPEDTPVLDLDASVFPTALTLDGDVLRWGDWQQTGGEPTVSRMVMQIDGGCVLDSSQRLLCHDRPDPIAAGARIMAGAPACWIDDMRVLRCADREGPHDGTWAALDRHGENLCAIDTDGGFACLDGPARGVTWEGSTDARVDFPQRDHLPQHPRWVEVDVDFDQRLCLRDVHGRVACRWGGVPDEVTSRSGWAELDVTEGTSCAIHSEGDVACWGDDTYGEGSPPE